MAYPSEHAKAITDAIVAAKADGLQLYVDWSNNTGECMLNLYHYSSGQIDLGNDLVIIEEY